MTQKGFKSLKFTSSRLLNLVGGNGANQKTTHDYDFLLFFLSLFHLVPFPRHLLLNIPEHAFIDPLAGSCNCLQWPISIPNLNCIASSVPDTGPGSANLRGLVTLTMPLWRWFIILG